MDLVWILEPLLVEANFDLKVADIGCKDFELGDPVQSLSLKPEVRLHGLCVDAQREFLQVAAANLAKYPQMEVVEAFVTPSVAKELFTLPVITGDGVPLHILQVDIDSFDADVLE